MIRCLGGTTRIVPIILLVLLLCSIWTAGCSSMTSPASIEIVFASDRRPTRPFSALYAMDAEGRVRGPLKNMYWAIHNGASWSPDGTTLALQYVLPEGHEGITLVKFTASGTERTDYGPCRYSPAWSPDGRYLAFYTDCDNKSALSIAEISSGQEADLVTDLPERLDNGTFYEVRISWSPDSQFLAYDVRDEQGKYEIWIVSRDGKSNHFLTDGSEPAWSPTGDEIAFERDGDIWILSKETGEEYRLVDDPIRAHWPVWSPTGDQLLFVSWRDDSEENRRTTIANTEIYRINRDGTELLNLTQDPGWDAFPAWRPASPDNP